ncbi:PepSY-associated TM helix domain-containing protein [Methylosinus sp. LW4]|uniref:PepSY-associated TM helix domain-containing protein n=1 Tax=Methylosinus sp. LW4 TaxID=136993 RepID=UPI000368FB1F|nr:PepSY-associated TM helix domain-containing protein [Methylosinus sp. LW4]
MRRAVFVLVHRWVGLSMAGFLILVGLTGALLAFLPELNHWLSPRLFPGGSAGVALDASALALRAEALVPEARVQSVFFNGMGSATIRIEARPGAPPLEFDQLFLGEGSGEELGRRSTRGLPDGANTILPFVYRLHYALALGEPGGWILGLVAIAWTLDCFVGFYLTLPSPGGAHKRGFLERWKPSWLVKFRASFYRVNFDLHRAGGLWLWAALFVFAWSSVFMNMNAFYMSVTELLFDFERPIWALPAPPLSHADRAPLGWREAQAIGARLMDEQAQANGFTVDRQVALAAERSEGRYRYSAHSSLDIGEKYGSTSVYFDACSGALLSLDAPSGRRSGNTLTTWLMELHMANVFGPPYRIFVGLLGVFIAILSLTGVTIWWKKRRARADSTPRRSVARVVA